MTDRTARPPMSAELRALQDRDFADRLHQRLLEKNAGAADGKVEPIFKGSGAAKLGAAPPTPMPQAPLVESGEAPGEKIPGKSPDDEAIERAKLDGATASKPVVPVAEPLVQPLVAPVAASAAPLPSAVPVKQAEPPAPRTELRRLERQAIAGLPLVMLAAQFAADRHKTQRRRGAAREPYINHLLEVAALLATATEGQDPELVVAGLLHDLIEDQGVSVDEIARQFGVGVAALVLEVTTDKSLPELERHRLQVAHAAHKSPRARLLRIADLTSNLRALRQSPPADWSVERQRDYLLWAHDVATGSRGLNPQLDDLFDEAYGDGMAALDTALAAPTA